MIPLRKPAAAPTLDESATEDLTYISRIVNAEQIIADGLRRFAGQRSVCDLLLDVRNALRPPEVAS